MVPRRIDKARRGGRAVREGGQRAARCLALAAGVLPSPWRRKVRRNGSHVKLNIAESSCGEAPAPNAPVTPGFCSDLKADFGASVLVDPERLAVSRARDDVHAVTVELFLRAAVRIKHARIADPYLLQGAPPNRSGPSGRTLKSTLIFGGEHALGNPISKFNIANY